MSVTTFDGDSYLTETVDTSGHAHTAEYLQEVATSAIISTEQRYNCKVGTLVTENASNMVKMRRQLTSDSDTTDTNIISYGCSAHYLNLLAKDIEIPGVKERIIQIVTYFGIPISQLHGINLLAARNLYYHKKFVGTL